MLNISYMFVTALDTWDTSNELNWELNRHTSGSYIPVYAGRQ